MKLSVIALKNLKRNFSFYSLYLCSVSLVLTIFFCFTSFSMNEIIMEKISADGRVETMCQTVAVFLMAFVVFCLVRTINRFHQKKETVPAAPPAPPEPSNEEKLLAEIRDLLKGQR